MTKQQYFQLRVQQNGMLNIMYQHHVDLLKGSPGTLTFEQYKLSLNHFVKLQVGEDVIAQQSYFDWMYEQSVSYFDKKFDVIYVTMEVTKEIKETITILK